MGLPQVSSGNSAEEVAATSSASFLQSPQRLSGVSTCDLDGMHGGSVSQTAVETQCSPIGEFQRKASLESSKFADGSFKSGGSNDATSSVHGFKITSADKVGLFIPKSGWNTPNPVSRIVGFESCETSSLSKELQGVSADDAHSSSVDGVAVNGTEGGGSLVRKRLLSPLKTMLFPDQFNGDPLDIGFSNSQMNLPVRINSSSVSTSQDYKKVNVGSKIQFTTSSWSESSCFEQKIVPYDNSRTSSIILTDGPLLENNDTGEHNNFLFMPGLDQFNESSKVISHCGLTPISPQKAISPCLSLSPLGPKFSERIETVPGCRKVKKEIGDRCSTLKNLEESINDSDSGIIFSTEEAEFMVGRRSFEDVHKEFRPSSLESTAGLSWRLQQESPPTSQCFRFVRSLSGLSVRRSLVGSFEESLLSGRLISGKSSQVSTFVLL